MGEGVAVTIAHKLHNFPVLIASKRYQWSRTQLYPYAFLAVAVFASFPTLSAQTSFPDVKDSRDVMITFQRTDPMGGRPSYKLIVSGDGLVQYDGLGNVTHTGKRTRHISEAAVSELIEEFRSAHFFDLNDYRSSETDQPARVISFQIGFRRKQIVDYGLESHAADLPDGLSSGAPESLIQLEKRIDETAGAKKWVNDSWVRRKILRKPPHRCCYIEFSQQHLIPSML
jgi:hypothetical protein